MSWALLSKAVQRAAGAQNKRIRELAAAGVPDTCACLESAAPGCGGDGHAGCLRCAYFDADVCAADLNEIEPTCDHIVTDGRSS